MSICRTCLTSENLIRIFTDEDLNTRCEQILTATGVKIEPNDGLPQLICQECVKLINDALKLRQQSSEAEQILLKNKLSFEIRKHNIKIEIGNTNANNLENIENEITLNSDENYIFVVNKTRKDNTKIKQRLVQKYSKHRNRFKNINSVKKKNLEIEKKSRQNASDENLVVEIENVEEENIYNDNVELSSNPVEGTTESKKRRRISKEQLQKYMSLAVQPYDKEGAIQCKLCHKELRAARYFISHAKTHFEAENACEYCSRKFVTVNSMRCHQQRVHGAARRLACDECTYRAIDNHQLQNHKRGMHTGERPYMCDVCGDTFRLRAGVAQHMRTHFADKTIQCERCPAMFRSRSELAGHRNKVHLMLYTYLCYLCPGKYKAVSTVKNHLVKTHGVPRDQHLPIKYTKEKRE